MFLWDVQSVFSTTDSLEVPLCTEDKVSAGPVCVVYAYVNVLVHVCLVLPAGEVPDLCSHSGVCTRTNNIPVCVGCGLCVAKFCLLWEPLVLG